MLLKLAAIRAAEDSELSFVVYCKSCGGLVFPQFRCNCAGGTATVDSDDWALVKRVIARQKREAHQLN